MASGCEFRGMLHEINKNNGDKVRKFFCYLQISNILSLFYLLNFGFTLFFSNFAQEKK
jgi:hypothetical protein